VATPQASASVIAARASVIAAICPRMCGRSPISSGRDHQTSSGDTRFALHWISAIVPLLTRTTRSAVPAIAPFACVKVQIHAAQGHAAQGVNLHPSGTLP
jgi:hypothetical protein